MTGINSKKLLHIKEIEFTDGNFLYEATAFIVEGFLIVESKRPDNPNPSWYSLHGIAALHGVEIVQEEKKGGHIGVVNYGAGFF